MPTIEKADALPDLPPGWVPDGAVLLGIAKHHHEDGVWEVSLPEFAIVGRAGSFEDAAHQAGELLEDYMRLCAADGMTFEEARRPMSPTWYARALTVSVASGVWRRIRHRQVRSRVLRVPARHAFG